eukprot:2714242-Lingulodinium_polyedra.AAC.1
MLLELGHGPSDVGVAPKGLRVMVVEQQAPTERQPVTPPVVEEAAEPPAWDDCSWRPFAARLLPDAT